MATNILPLLLAAGAAAVLLGKKKKKKKATPLIEQLHPELPPMVAPQKKKRAGSATVKKRQQSLVDTGYDVGPSGVDGKMGPNTRAAIRAFQSDAGITVDGLWGPQTAAAMAQALRMAVEGLGRAAYGQIGSMLDKFKDAFDKFFEPGEGGEKKTAKPKSERPTARISILDDVIITSSGFRYNLNAFSVPNLVFCHPEKGQSICIGSSGEGIRRNFKEWDGKDRVVGIFCRLDDFVPIVEIGKDLAMRNPDLFFVVIAPNFRFTKSIEMLKKIKEGNRPADYIERNRNAIALYGDIDDLIAQKWGKTYGYWEKKAETLVKNGEYLENYFKSMHSMGVRDPYEYKERLEKTMWLLLADLRAKARW